MPLIRSWEYKRWGNLRGPQLDRLGSAGLGEDSEDEFFEDLAVKRTCSRGLGMELAADNEPIF